MLIVYLCSSHSYRTFNVKRFDFQVYSPNVTIAFNIMKESNFLNKIENIWCVFVIEFLRINIHGTFSIYITLTVHLIEIPSLILWTPYTPRLARGYQYSRNDNLLQISYSQEQTFSNRQWAYFFFTILNEQSWSKPDVRSSCALSRKFPIRGREHDGFLAFNFAIILTRRERLATCCHGEANWSDELSVGYHLVAVGSCVGWMGE